MIFNTIEELEKHVINLRESKIKPIVIISGTFRTFHAGHYYIFQEAKKIAENCKRIGCLICLINSTKSTKKIKPKAKFILPDEQRKVLALYAGADFVYMFDEKTPAEICRRIEPDVLVKGSDWEGKNLPEAKYCKRVKLIKRIDLTTAEKILGKLNVKIR